MVYNNTIVRISSYCKYCGEKSRGSNDHWLLSLAIFHAVTDIDSLISLALEICATILPDVDAILQLWKFIYTSAYILCMAKLELLKLHLKGFEFVWALVYNNIIM